MYDLPTPTASPRLSPPPTVSSVPHIPFIPSAPIPSVPPSFIFLLPFHHLKSRTLTTCGEKCCSKALPLAGNVSGASRWYAFRGEVTECKEIMTTTPTFCQVEIAYPSPLWSSRGVVEFVPTFHVGKIFVAHAPKLKAAGAKFRHEKKDNDNTGQVLCWTCVPHNYIATA